MVCVEEQGEKGRSGGVNNQETAKYRRGGRIIPGNIWICKVRIGRGSKICQLYIKQRYAFDRLKEESVKK